MSTGPQNYRNAEHLRSGTPSDQMVALTDAVLALTAAVIDTGYRQMTPPKQRAWNTAFVPPAPDEDDE